MYYLFFIKLKDCYIQILSNVIRDSIKNGVLFQPAVITRSSDNFFFTEDKQANKQNNGTTSTLLLFHFSYFNRSWSIQYSLVFTYSFSLFTKDFNYASTTVAAKNGLQLFTITITLFFTLLLYTTLQ